MRSSSAFQPRASISSPITSTSPISEAAARFIRSESSERLCHCKPGVSTNTYWASSRVSTPRTRLRVVCALRDVIEIFWPTSALTSVDLPTLGRPISAIRPVRKSAGSGIDQAWPAGSVSVEWPSGSPPCAPASGSVGAAGSVGTAGGALRRARRIA